MGHERGRRAPRHFDMLRVLADENRLVILSLLAEHRELCARDILSYLSISQPTLSHHMNALLENHLVEARKSGRWVFYRVSGQSIRELIAFFEALTKSGGKGAASASVVEFAEPKLESVPKRPRSLPRAEAVVPVVEIEPIPAGFPVAVLPEKVKKDKKKDGKNKLKDKDKDKEKKSGKKKKRKK